MFICTCPIVKSGKLFITVSFNTIFSSIGNLGLTAFRLIEFRPEPVSIIASAALKVFCAYHYQWNCTWFGNAYPYGRLIIRSGCFWSGGSNSHKTLCNMKF